MKLSTKSRYGLRAVYSLAEAENAAHKTLNQIATESGVTPAYLEKLLTMLKKDGIVQTVRGAGGGYKLVRSPKDISVGEVLRSLEGNLFITDCTAEKCKAACPNKMVFTKLYQEMNKLLDNMSILDMINDNQ